MRGRDPLWTEPYLLLVGRGLSGLGVVCAGICAEWAGSELGGRARSAVWPGAPPDLQPVTQVLERAGPRALPASVQGRRGMELFLRLQSLPNSEQ